MLRWELYILGVTDNKYIYWEYESGTKDDRAELQKLLDIVSEGDSIATTEVSRLTRSTKHLCEILQTVKEKKLILDIGGFFRVDGPFAAIAPGWGFRILGMGVGQAYFNAKLFCFHASGSAGFRLGGQLLLPDDDHN
ncbi:MAG: recombinase family protein, partial [Lachnospiraceae bacterium]|nr:recombinase family protein [Lachnospiraceae bacterium]